MLLWQNEIENIKGMLTEGKTTVDIGKYYNVSRQRIYQVLTKFGLQTNVKIRKNFLRDKEPKYYWLNKMLTMKKIEKKERTFLLNNINLPDFCPVLGIPLNYLGTGLTSFSRTDNSASIDQIIAGKGYTKDNMIIISWRANRIKNNGTPEEHFKIYDFFSKLTNYSLQV